MDESAGENGAGTVREIRIGWPVLLVLGVALVAAAGFAIGRRLTLPGAGTANVVAEINGTPITTRDVDVELAIQSAIHKQAGEVLTTSASDLAAYRRDILDELVDQALMYDAAAAAGLAIAPEDARAAIANMMPGVDMSGLQASAVAEGVTEAEFLRWASRQQSISGYLRTDAAMALAREERARRGLESSPYGLDPSEVATALQRQAEITFYFEGFDGDSGAGVAIAREGEPAPDFTLGGLSGQPVRLSDFLGSPVMLNFWATWCGPCKVEMPLFVHTYERNQAAGLVILAVDVQEAAATVQPFVNEYRMTFPVALDADGQVATLYRVQGLPTTMFIDAEGRLVKAHRGAIVDRAQLLALVQTILPSAESLAPAGRLLARQPSLRAPALGR
jgi:peroxiredoxin